MDKPYPYEKKKKLAERIGRIKKKDDLKAIFSIIKEENKSLATSNNDNGIFMMFHNLSNSTYYRIEKHIRQINIQNQEISESASETSEKKTYKPYTIDDFPAQEKLSPKLKYSNKEKNLIKRQRYNDNITDEAPGKTVIYCDFQVENTTDSEIYSETIPEISVSKK